MKRFGVALFVLVGGCETGRDLAPIVVDIASNCASADVDAVVRDLDDEKQPWESVFAAALDSPGLDRFWLLVSNRDESGTLQLTLVHVNDGQVDAEMPVNGVDVNDVTFELLAGPAPGQAFLVATASGTLRIWHVDAALPSSPLVALSQELGGFPFANNCDPDFEGNLRPCDTADWFRGVGFVAGQPIVVSVPPMSPTSTMFMHVASLSSSLSINSTTQLEFVRDCDIDDPDAVSECADIENTTYPSVDVLGFQLDPTRSSHQVFMMRERAVLGVPQGLDLVTATIQLDDSGNIAAILQSKAPKEIELVKGPPGGLAVDDFATYMLHPTGNRGPVITKLSGGGGTFDVLADIIVGEDDALIQMDADIALARINGEDQLEVTKLFPDDPERSATTVYEADDVVRFEPAGVGALLVHKERGGPDLVQLRCSDLVVDEDGG